MPKGSKLLNSYRFQKYFHLEHQWLQKWLLKFCIFVVRLIQGSIYVVILSVFEAFAFRPSWTLVNFTHVLWKFDSLAAILAYRKYTQMGGTCVIKLFVKVWRIKMLNEYKYLFLFIFIYRVNLAVVVKALYCGTIILWVRIPAQPRFWKSFIFCSITSF